MCCFICLSLVGCGKKCDADGNICSEQHQETESLGTYAYESRFATGDVPESSVSYNGQVVRHLLIADMMRYLDELTERIDSGEFVPTAGQVVDDLAFFIDFDLDTVPNYMTGLRLELPLLQSRYADLTTAKNLREKLAGNDPIGQYRDWNTDGLIGISPKTTPEALVASWINAIDALAVARTQSPATDPSGNAISAVYISPEGVDYKTLLHRFLLGAIAYSQAADDYLGHDVEDKGLLSDNSNVEEGKNYTALEHAWDEAFGYFGAARDYDQYIVDEIAGLGGRDDWKAGYYDSDQDGKIDLLSEYNMGDAVVAADHAIFAGDTYELKHTYHDRIFNAFVKGRAIVTQPSSSSGKLTGKEFNLLLAQCAEILTSWDQLLRFQAVRSINGFIAAATDMDTMQSFSEVARQWSDSLGYALALQFNPMSGVSSEDLAEIISTIGVKPVLLGGAISADYIEGVEDARSMIARGLPPIHLVN